MFVGLGYTVCMFVDYCQVYNSLSLVPNMRVYGKHEIPERFHYKGGKFVSPLTLVAEPSWFITEVRDKGDDLYVKYLHP